MLMWKVNLILITYACIKLSFLHFLNTHSPCFTGHFDQIHVKHTWPYLGLQVLPPPYLWGISGHLVLMLTKIINIFLNDLFNMPNWLKLLKYMYKKINRYEVLHIVLNANCVHKYGQCLINRLELCSCRLKLKI